MSVIKEKKFTVSSVIENGDGEPSEKSESEVFGTLKISEDSYGISYTEEGEGVSVKTFITVNADGVRVKRLGGIESDMQFKVGVAHASLYKIPPYSFDAEVTCEKICSDMRDSVGSLYILYTLKIGGAEKRVEMKITY